MVTVLAAAALLSMTEGVAAALLSVAEVAVLLSVAGVASEVVAERATPLPRERPVLVRDRPSPA